jgi:photosystem II stability/assembly factor-like uncharacterized protein
LIVGRSANEVFALTRTSLYRSTDFGKEWSLVFSVPLEVPRAQSFWPVSAYEWHLIFQQSSADPQVMYLALVGHTSNTTTDFYGGSLWRSVDGGKNWQHLNDSSYASGSMVFDPHYKTGIGSVVTSLAISPRDPNILFMTGIEGRLYKSLNGGAGWADVTPPNISPFQVVINPRNAENMYLLDGQNNPLETTDSGSTWHEMKYDLTLMETGFEAFYDKSRRWTWITFHPTLPTRLLGVVNSHLVESDDGGGTWKDISFVIGTFKYRTNSYRDGERQGYNIAPVGVLWFSGAATDTIYVGANDGIYKSSDLGKTWTPLFKEPVIDFVMSNDEKRILALTHFGSFISSEGFIQWTNVGTPLPPATTTELSVVDSFGSPIYLRIGSSIYLGKSDGDLLISPNGLYWEWETNPFKNVQCYTKADYHVIQYFKTQDGTSYTVGDCGGMGFRKIIRELPDKKQEEIRASNLGYDQLRNCRIAISPLDSQKIYLYSDRKLHVSENGGRDWEESINNGVSVVVVSPRNPNTAYAVLTSNNNSLNSVITTTDGGKSWHAGTPSLQDVAITQGINDQFWSVTAAPEDPNVAYVTSRNAIFRTSDAGQTWTLVTRNRFNGEIYDVTFEHGSREVVYLATSNGAWRSNDSGKSWIAFSEGIPIYRIISTKDFTIAFGKEMIYRLGNKARNEGAAGPVTPFSNDQQRESLQIGPIMAENPNRDSLSRPAEQVTSQGGGATNSSTESAITKNSLTELSKEEIISMVEQAFNASIKGDRATIDSMLDESFTYTNLGNRKTWDRATFLSKIKRDKSIKSYHCGDYKVSFEGETASIIGICQYHVEDLLISMNVKKQFRDRLVKKDGKWKVVSSEEIILPNAQQNR